MDDGHSEGSSRKPTQRRQHHTGLVADEGQSMLLCNDLRHAKRDGNSQEVADEEEDRAGGVHDDSVACCGAVSSSGRSDSIRQS